MNKNLDLNTVIITHLIELYKSDDCKHIFMFIDENYFLIQSLLIWSK